jgi:hypothetical protein
VGTLLCYRSTRRSADLARERKLFSWRRVLVLLLPVIAFGILYAMTLEIHPSHRAHPRVYCMNNLRSMGYLIFEEGEPGRLERVPGSGFLKQLAIDVRDEDLGIFVCPGDPRYPFADDPDQPWLVENLEDLVKRYRRDWRTAPCSYRGPDAELLAEALRPNAPRLIIACDLNGPDGRDPFQRTVSWCSTTTGRWISSSGS